MFVVQSQRHRQIRWVIQQENMSHVIWRDHYGISSVSLLGVKQQPTNGERHLIGHLVLSHAAMMDVSTEKLFVSM